MDQALPGSVVEFAQLKGLEEPYPSEDLLFYAERQEMLPPELFHFSRTRGVRQDIISASNESGVNRIYAAASQFNGTEATYPFTPKPGEVMQASEEDHTQGPQTQRTNPFMFELINAASNIGFNELTYVLSEQSRKSLRHGYLTPKNEAQALCIAQDFKDRWQELQILCAKSVPQCEGVGKQSVTIMLGAAPAFGDYSSNPQVERLKASHEIQFYSALANFTAQFNHALRMATTSRTTRVVLHPCAVGLGVFGNDPRIVGLAFKLAATRFNKLISTRGLKNVVVQFEAFDGGHGINQKVLDFVQVVGLKEAPRV